MVEVLFFASIREQLQVDRLSLSFDREINTVESLLNSLVANREPVWSQVLLADNVVKAVNHEVVEGSHPLQDGDEVAFFPPVTGG